MSDPEIECKFYSKGRLTNPEDSPESDAKEFVQCFYFWTDGLVTWKPKRPE